jgi:hypothetical protein
MAENDILDIKFSPTQTHFGNSVEHLKILQYVKSRCAFLITKDHLQANASYFLSYKQRSNIRENLTEAEVNIICLKIVLTMLQTIPEPDKTWRTDIQEHGIPKYVVNLEQIPYKSSDEQLKHERYEQHFITNEELMFPNRSNIRTELIEENGEIIAIERFVNDNGVDDFKRSSATEEETLYYNIRYGGAQFNGGYKIPVVKPSHGFSSMEEEFSDYKYDPNIKLTIPEIFGWRIHILFIDGFYTLHESPPPGASMRERYKEVSSNFCLYHLQRNNRSIINTGEKIENFPLHKLDPRHFYNKDQYLEYIFTLTQQDLISQTNNIHISANDSDSVSEASIENAFHLCYTMLPTNEDLDPRQHDIENYNGAYPVPKRVFWYSPSKLDRFLQYELPITYEARLMKMDKIYVNNEHAKNMTYFINRKLTKIQDGIEIIDEDKVREYNKRIGIVHRRQDDEGNVIEELDNPLSVNNVKNLIDLQTSWGSGNVHRKPFNEWYALHREMYSEIEAEFDYNCKKNSAYKYLTTSQLHEKKVELLSSFWTRAQENFAIWWSPLNSQFLSSSELAAEKYFSETIGKLGNVNFLRFNKRSSNLSYFEDYVCEFFSNMEDIYQCSNAHSVAYKVKLGSYNASHYDRKSGLWILIYGAAGKSKSFTYQVVHFNMMIEGTSYQVAHMTDKVLLVPGYNDHSCIYQDEAIESVLGFNPERTKAAKSQTAEQLQTVNRYKIWMTDGVLQADTSGFDGKDGSRTSVHQVSWRKATTIACTNRPPNEMDQFNLNRQWVIGIKEVDRPGKNPIDFMSMPESVLKDIQANSVSEAYRFEHMNHFAICQAIKIGAIQQKINTMFTKIMAPRLLKRLGQYPFNIERSKLEDLRKFKRLITVAEEHTITRAILHMFRSPIRKNADKTPFTFMELLLTSAHLVDDDPAIFVTSVDTIKEEYVDDLEYYSLRAILILFMFNNIYGDNSQVEKEYNEVLAREKAEEERKKQEEKQKYLYTSELYEDDAQSSMETTISQDQEDILRGVDRQIQECKDERKRAALYDYKNTVQSRFSGSSKAPPPPLNGRPLSQSQQPPLSTESKKDSGVENQISSSSIRMMAEDIPKEYWSDPGTNPSFDKKLKFFLDHPVFQHPKKEGYIKLNIFPNTKESKAHMDPMKYRKCKNIAERIYEIFPERPRVEMLAETLISMSKKKWYKDPKKLDEEQKKIQLQEMKLDDKNEFDKALLAYLDDVETWYENRKKDRSYQLDSLRKINNFILNLEIEREKSIDEDKKNYLTIQINDKRSEYDKLKLEYNLLNEKEIDQKEVDTWSNEIVSSITSSSAFIIEDESHYVSINKDYILNLCSDVMEKAVKSVMEYKHTIPKQYIFGVNKFSGHYHVLKVIDIKPDLSTDLIIENYNYLSKSAQELYKENERSRHERFEKNATRAGINQMEAMQLENVQISEQALKDQEERRRIEFIKFNEPKIVVDQPLENYIKMEHLKEIGFSKEMIEEANAKLEWVLQEDFIQYNDDEIAAWEEEMKKPDLTDIQRKDLERNKPLKLKPYPLNMGLETQTDREKLFEVNRILNPKNMLSTNFTDSISKMLFDPKQIERMKNNPLERWKQQQIKKRKILEDNIADKANKKQTVEKNVNNIPSIQIQENTQKQRTYLEEDPDFDQELLYNEILQERES